MPCLAGQRCHADVLISEWCRQKGVPASSPPPSPPPAPSSRPCPPSLPPAVATACPWLHPRTAANARVLPNRSEGSRSGSGRGVAQFGSSSKRSFYDSARGGRGGCCVHPASTRRTRITPAAVVQARGQTCHELGPGSVMLGAAAGSPWRAPRAAVRSEVTRLFVVCPCSRPGEGTPRTARVLRETRPSHTSCLCPTASR